MEIFCGSYAVTDHWITEGGTIASGKKVNVMAFTMLDWLEVGSIQLNFSENTPQSKCSSNPLKSSNITLIKNVKEVWYKTHHEMSKSTKSTQTFSGPK